MSVLLQFTLTVIQCKPWGNVCGLITSIWLKNQAQVACFHSQQNSSRRCGCSTLLCRWHYRWGNTSDLNVWLWPHKPSRIHFFPQAYHQSLNHHPTDTSLSGMSHTRLFLTSFSLVILSWTPNVWIFCLLSNWSYDLICCPPGQLWCWSILGIHAHRAFLFDCSHLCQI